jgi:lipopolysaccharide cholinephosphotransferase
MDWNELYPDRREEGENELRRTQLVMLRILKIVDHLCRELAITYWLDSGTLLGAVRHQGFIPWDDDLDIVMPRQDYERFIKTAGEKLPEDLFLQTRDTDPAFYHPGGPQCKIRDKYSVKMERWSNPEAKYQGIYIDVFPADKFCKSQPARAYEHVLRRFYRNLCKVYEWQVKRPAASLKERLLNLASACGRKTGLIKKGFQCYATLVRKRIRHNEVLKDHYQIGCGFELVWIRYFEKEEIYPLRKLSFEDAEFFAPNQYDRILRKSYGDYQVLPPAEQRQAHAPATLVIDTRKHKKMPSV